MAVYNIDDGKEVVCDICGWNMRDEKTQVVHVGLNILIPPDDKEGKHLKEMFGRTKFRICVGCMLKSAGVIEVPKRIEEQLNQIAPKNEERISPKKKIGRPRKFPATNLTNTEVEVNANL